MDELRTRRAPSRTATLAGPAPAPRTGPRHRKVTVDVPRPRASHEGAVPAMATAAADAALASAPAAGRAALPDDPSIFAELRSSLLLLLSAVLVTALVAALATSVRVGL